MQVESLPSLPFFPFSIPIAIPHPSTRRAGRADLAVHAPDWRVPDSGYVPENPNQLRLREQRRLQRLLCGKSADTQQQTHLEEDPLEDDRASNSSRFQDRPLRGTALFVVRSVDDLFVCDLGEEMHKEKQQQSDNDLPAQSKASQGRLLKAAVAAEFEQKLEDLGKARVCYVSAEPRVLSAMTAYDRWR